MPPWNAANRCCYSLRPAFVELFSFTKILEYSESHSIAFLKVKEGNVHFEPVFFLVF